MDYKYTIPRGPIAAQFGSPGPCYGLPGLTGKQRHDPRSVHYCNPAYPFGVRHGKMRDECGPGPAYFPNPRYSNKGPDGTPQYSLYGRKDADLKTTTPGPAAYSTQNIPPPDHPRQPAYTFGTRRRSRRTDDTPGIIINVKFLKLGHQYFFTIMALKWKSMVLKCGDTSTTTEN